MGYNTAVVSDPEIQLRAVGTVLDDKDSSSESDKHSILDCECDCVQGNTL